MSTALVEIFNSQPATTSLAIAGGVGIKHKNVIAIARKYVNELQKLGRVAFETRPFETNGGIQYQEIALLNEGQAMFFLTLQKNTEKVVQFKLALIKAFLELRDKAKSVGNGFNPSTFPIQHQADHLVAADRMFRAMLRSAKSCGTTHAHSIFVAGKLTQELTGIDVPGMLNLKPEIKNPVSKTLDEFIAYFKSNEFYFSTIENLYYDFYIPFANSSSEHRKLALDDFNFSIRARLQELA